MVLIYSNVNFFMITIILLWGTLSNAQGLVLDNVFEKKIKKILKKEYPQKDYIDYIEIQKETNRIIYKIQSNNEQIGYVSLCRAKSMYDIFDYAIFFNLNTQITLIKIFKYNEDYGYEIAAKWFLKQFYKKRGGNNMNYSYNIDGISGATISAKSITNDIKEVSKIVSSINIEEFFKTQEL